MKKKRVLISLEWLASLVKENLGDFLDFRDDWKD